MRLSLNTRMVISLLALVLTGFIVLAIVLLTNAKSRIDQFLETQAVYQVQTLAQASLDGLVSEDYELLESWVNSSIPSDNYAYAALVRSNGQVMSHTDPNYIGKNITTITGVSKHVSRISEYQQRPVKEIISPAKIGGQVLANAHVAYYMDAGEFINRDTAVEILIILTVIFTVILIAGYMLMRGITGPIEILRQIISKSSLDKSVNIDQKIINRADEVGDLARAFEDTSERLVH